MMHFDECFDKVGIKNDRFHIASLSINPASRAGACTDCEYIECSGIMILQLHACYGGTCMWACTHEKIKKKQNNLVRFDVCFDQILS